MLHWKNALVVEFGVRAGDTAQSLCPVYEMLQLGDRGHLNHKRGTVFRHSLRLAHDILLVENAAVSVRFSVYCTCRYVSRPSPREGRSAAPVVVPLRHDLEYLPAIACDRLGDRVQQELRQLHLDAIRREAEQLLLPQELIGNPHIHVCPLDQSFVSELDLPTSAAYPLECSRLTIAIRSATGTGKSTLIRRITSPLDPLLDLLELWQFPHPRGEPFDIGFLISRWLPLRFGPHSSQPPLCLFVHAKTRQQLFWIRCMLPREQQENMRVPPQAADHPEWDDSQWRDEWFSWLCEVVLQGALRLQLEPVSNDDGRCLWCIREQSFEALLEQWGSVPRYSSRLQRDPRSQRVDSVMFLSALRSIATSIEAAYGVVNYMNHFGYNGGTSESFALIRRVVCSLESVNKCLRPRYFTVVIDEVETLLGRAHSKTMGRDAERSQKLQHAFYFMRRAGVLLLAEFSLSRETLALALKLRPPTANSPLVLYYNVYSGRRPAVKLLLPKSGEDVHEPLRRVAVTMARANAFRAPNVAPVPMVVACQSKAFGREIAKIFRQYDPHAPTLFIHNAHDERERPVSESPDDPDREELQQRAMHDPTHEWCKYRYVIFTTKVLAALDCNPLVPYFGIMLSQGDRGFTGLAEHLIQQEGRSRTLTSNVILRTTSTASAAMNRRPLCTDAHVIREHLLANSEQERALYNRLVGGIFSDEPHINSADGLLEPTYVIGNENELNLFLNNVVRERRTLNDPRDRSLQLSHDAGSGIELLVPDDVEWLLRRLFPELVLEGLDDEVPRMAADNESLSQEQWAHAIVHAVPSAEQQRAYDLRTFHVRTESERYVWQHMSVQRCLGTSTLTGELSEESLVKDVMFAMGRTAHQQVRLFLLLKNDIGHATTVAEHHPSSDGSLLSQRHPLLVRGIMMDLLRIGGFRAVDDDRHVLCQSYANHWNVVGNLQQYVQHLPLPQVEELTALQKIRLALLNVSDWKSCLQLFRLFFQLVGLALGKCHDSRGGVAKAGYQLEYDSVRRMREIHERTAFGTVAPLTMFTLRFEATTRAALAVVTDQQHLHVDGGLDPIRSLVQVLAVHFVDLGLSPHPLPAAHNWVHRSISTPPLTFDAGFPSLDWFVNRWQASEESLVVLRRTQEDADDRIRLHECVGFALILHKNCFFVSATCNSATSVSLVCELLHAPLSLSAACLEYAQNHCGGNDAIQHAEVWPV